MFVCREEPDFDYEKTRFNYSLNSDFFDVLLNITENHQKLWFEEGNATWQGDLSPRHFETVNVNGIGFTYNTYSAEEILNQKR